FNFGHVLEEELEVSDRHTLAGVVSLLAVWGFNRYDGSSKQVQVEGTVHFNVGLSNSRITLWNVLDLGRMCLTVLIVNHTPQLRSNTAQGESDQSVIVTLHDWF